MLANFIQIAIKILCFAAMLASCAIFFLMLQELGSKSEDAGDKALKGIDKASKKNGAFAKQKREMSKLGIMYRAGNYNLNPSWYIMTRIAVGIIAVLLAGLWKGFTLGVLLAFPLGYIGTSFYFKRKNLDDNKAIMMDLYNTYANLKIQMDAGIYIADSLEYVHKNIKNKRYREAMGELIVNFADKTIPMHEAVEIFRDRFDSKEIDKLCTLIQNCIFYGAQETYTKDIMGEIQSIIRASTMESEHDIESKTGIIRFAFFAILIFVIMYAAFSGMGNMNLFV